MGHLGGGGDCGNDCFLKECRWSRARVRCVFSVRARRVKSPGISLREARAREEREGERRSPEESG